MDPVFTFLIAVAGLFLLGAVGELIFTRTQIPDVVWLIVAGIVLGPMTGVVPREAMIEISPYFGALALIVILFEGGIQLVLHDLVKAAPRASVLAVTSFLVTVTAVALMSWGLGAIGALPGWSLLHGVMLGAILGGSSSLIIMPSMALANVEQKVASLVNLESALTDALCVVVTVAVIDVMSSGEGTAGGAAWILAKNFGIALAIGVGVGWMWIPVMRILSGKQHAYPMTVAALILLYVLVDALGGSAAMGILAFAVMVGNAASIMKRLGFSLGDGPVELGRSVRAVHSQITFIVKSFFFTFIGLMLTPPWSLLALGVVVGCLLLAARAPVVALVTRGGGFTYTQRKVVAISLPRGMAAGVLATLPAYEGIGGTTNLPSLVFAAVSTSILIFAVGFPLLRRQLGPADRSDQQRSPSPTPASAGDPPIVTSIAKRDLMSRTPEPVAAQPFIPAPAGPPADHPDGLDPSPTPTSAASPAGASEPKSAGPSRSSS